MFFRMSYANTVTVRLCALDHTGFKVQYDFIKSLGNIPAKCAKALYGKKAIAIRNEFVNPNNVKI